MNLFVKVKITIWIIFWSGFYYISGSQVKSFWRGIWIEKVKITICQVNNNWRGIGIWRGDNI